MRARCCMLMRALPVCACVVCGLGNQGQDFVADYAQQTIYVIDYYRQCQFFCSMATYAGDACNAGTIDGSGLCDYDLINRSQFVGQSVIDGQTVNEFTYSDPLEGQTQHKGKGERNREKAPVSLSFLLLLFACSDLVCPLFVCCCLRVLLSLCQAWTWLTTPCGSRLASRRLCCSHSRTSTRSVTTQPQRHRGGRVTKNERGRRGCTTCLTLPCPVPLPSLFLSLRPSPACGCVVLCCLCVGTWQANVTTQYIDFVAGTPPASVFEFSNEQYCYQGNDAQCIHWQAKARDMQRRVPFWNIRAEIARKMNGHFNKQL